MKRILSLGAGVQSSTLLFMSERGELPKLDAAIFADTGDEPQEVYDWLQYLLSECKTPIIVASRGVAISDDVMSRVKSGRRLDKPPFFTLGEDGRASILKRDCTGTWKVREIEKAVRSLIGLAKGQRWPKSLTVEQWLGISWDERRRCKISTSAWQRFWHPLIEESWGDKKQPMWLTNPMSRATCLQWMSDNGYPTPPRSACWHCPFRSNEHWRHLRDNHPDDWEKAVKFDQEIRAHGNIHGMRNEVYLHRSLVPLGEAQIDSVAGDLFGDECAGVCGV